VDANNFQVSWERAFGYQLRDRPVVVLNNHDGDSVVRQAGSMHGPRGRREGLGGAMPVYICGDGRNSIAAAGNWRSATHTLERKQEPMELNGGKGERTMARPDLNDIIARLPRLVIVMRRMNMANA
jgi:hypothetical protein